jgi:hypothetical protein
VKLLVTMHMPSAQGNSVHQVTVEHQSKTLEELFRYLNDYEFIKCHLYYRERDEINGGIIWKSKGEILINTSHIGKVQEFIEYAEREKDDESYGYSEGISGHVGRQGTPLRKRGGYV